MEYTVEINLQKFVTIIDGLLELGGNFQCFREVRYTRVDEDGIRVTVQDLLAEIKMGYP